MATATEMGTATEIMATAMPRRPFDRPQPRGYAGALAIPTILGETAAFQVVIVLSGSVALLADTVHNLV